MFKRSWIAAAVALVLCAAAVAVQAQALPPKIGYTIYTEGKNVGHCEVTVSYKGQDLTLNSHTHVELPGGKIDIDCKTIADKDNFLARYLEWKGVKGGIPVSGHVTIDGDSLYGTTINGDDKKTDYVISPYDLTLVLEDFVMSHEVLIARAHVADGKRVGVYGIMFPSGFALTNCTVETASKAEIESEDTAIVCDKLLVAITGSQPFASFYDPQRGVPVYLAFPHTNVEVFLDDFFGDHPVSRYRETGESTE